MPLITSTDQPRRKLRAKVSYSYTPANDDELRLDVGDVVEVLKQEEEGWWEGMVNGKTGMFPSNFVEVQPEAEPEEPKTPVGNDKDKKKVKGVGLGNIFEHGPVHLKRTGEINKITTDTKTAPRVPEEKAQSTHSLTRNTAMKPAPALPPKDISENKKVDRARVLFSYVAENEDELSITEGDIIVILEKELEDSGWWKGELNGKVGVFPDNFVDILPPEENKPKKPPPPSVAKPSDVPVSRPAAPVVDKPRQDEKKPAPALPSKKPAMPPPPIGKKPLGPKHPTDLITQTDDHKVKESQKESGAGYGMVKSPQPSPHGRPGKLPAPRPQVRTEPIKPVTQKPEEIDLDSIPSGEPLSHPNAGRAKAPQRRLPTPGHREDEVLPPRGTAPRPAPPLPMQEPPKSPIPASREDDMDSAPGAPTPDLIRALADLRRELDTLRTTTVPRAQYDALEKEVVHLRETTSKLEKLTNVLMNDIDEGAKERRSMQVEIDRVRKLSMLPGHPAS